MKRVIVPMLILALGAQACSSGDGGDPGPADPGRAQGATGDEMSRRLAAMRLPIYDYLPTRQESDRIQDAIGLVTRKCMKRMGFDYRLPAAPTVDHEAIFGPNDELRRYGAIVLEHARKWGYTIPDKIMEPPGVRVRNPYTGSRRAAYTEALLGERTGVSRGPLKAANGAPIPAGGCAREANRTVAGTNDADFHGTANKINLGVFFRSLNDPEVRRTLVRWQACMRAKGYRLTSLEPGKAGDAYRSSRAPGGIAGPAEIKAAVADVHCHEQTDLVAVWVRTETRLQRPEIEKNQLVLRAERDRLRTALKKAAAVLAAG